MGGKLFPITRRYDKDEYEKIYPIIMKKVEKILNTEVFHVFTFRNKETFGDLDLLVLNNGNLGNVQEKIKEAFNTEHIHSNGNVISFVDKDFQVDLILTPTKNWKTAKVFFPMDPTGNLMGKIAHKFNLKYGFQGLVYPFRGFSGRNTKDIVISKDNRKIFDFLGFDYDRYLKGFDEVEEIFEYVINSQYFSYTNFLMKNLNAIDRKRNKKRKTYQEFLEYVNNHEYAKEFNIKFEKDKSAYIDIIEAWFPEANFKTQLKELEIKDLIAKQAAEQFNGRLVMEETGLTGKDLGKVLGDFKEFKVKQRGVSFTTAVVHDDDIMETFKQWYHLNFKK